MPRLTSRRWRFDFTVQMDPLSSQAEVSDLFRAILQDAKCKLDISGLEQSSFSCGVPEDGLAKVSGYLHVNKKFLLYEATVQKWTIDRGGRNRSGGAKSRFGCGTMSCSDSSQVEATDQRMSLTAKNRRSVRRK